jgi:hypothetical protein
MKNSFLCLTCHIFVSQETTIQSKADKTRVDTAETRIFSLLVEHESDLMSLRTALAEEVIT